RPPPLWVASTSSCASAASMRGRRLRTRGSVTRPDRRLHRLVCAGGSPRDLDGDGMSLRPGWRWPRARQQGPRRQEPSVALSTRSGARRPVSGRGVWAERGRGERADKAPARNAQQAARRTSDHHARDRSMASDSVSDAEVSSSSSKKAEDGSSTSIPAEEKATTAAPIKNHLSVGAAAAAVRERKKKKRSMEAKLAATKRRLREGYRRCAEAKRRRTLQVIEAAVALTCSAQFDFCE
ncbi:hypothetical protein BRADI_3g46316v3, partial [Brachypodium distachyon]